MNIVKSDLSEQTVPSWRRLVLWIAGFKIVYLSAITVALFMWDQLDPEDFATMMTRWPREGGPIFASHFAMWDAAHYLSISEVGYKDDTPSCAFYPLWPLLMRWTAPLFGSSHLIAGMVLSNAISTVAWALFYDSVAGRWGKEAAYWSLAFLVAFPGSLFFQFPYTESLFILLIVWLWRALQRRQYWSAWLPATLLPLTRGVGVFVVLPILWSLLSTSLHWNSFKNAEGRKRLDILRGLLRSSLLLAAAPLLGWGAYLAAMAYWTGDPFEGMKAQRFWGVHSIQNLWNVPKFLAGLFTPTQWHEFTGSVLDRCAFLLLLSCVPFMWRLDKSLLVWTYVLGVIPAMSGTFTSFTRFASCAFTIFVVLGFFLAGLKYTWPKYSVLGAFGLLHLLLLWRFVNLRWAG